MPSAVLHSLVAACMAIAPAASAPAPETSDTPEASSDAASTDDAPGDEDKLETPTSGSDDAAEAEAAASESSGEGADGADATDPAATDPAPATAEPLTEPAPASAPEDDPAPAVRTRPETASAPPPRAPLSSPPADSRRDDIVSKALLGGGLGSLGLGLGLAGVSAWFWVERAQADRNVDALDPGAARNEARDQRKQYGTLATATAVAGSVYVVTGVALLLLHTRDRKRVSASPTVGAVNGVVVQGRF